MLLRRQFGLLSPLFCLKVGASVPTSVHTEQCTHSPIKAQGRLPGLLNESFCTA